MKLVKESLNEFHQTGEPLGVLDIGLKSKTLEVNKIYDTELYTPEEIQELIYNDEVMIEFFNPTVYLTTYLTNDLVRLLPQTIYAWYKGKYEYIKYDGIYYKLVKE